MPLIFHDLPVYLDYDLLQPTATLEIPNLIPGHLYNFYVKFRVPDSENNLHLKNFMMTMHLISDSETLLEQKRPVHVRYKSPQLRQLSNWLNIFSVVTDNVNLESQYLTVGFIENFKETPKKVDSVKLILSNPDFETYEASLQIMTHFQGLAYFMYHWWLTCGIFIVSVIMLIETVVFSYLFKAFNSVSALDETREQVQTLLAPAEPGLAYEQLFDQDEAGTVVFEDDSFQPPQSVINYSPFQVTLSEHTRGTSFSQPYQFAPENLKSISGLVDSYPSSPKLLASENVETPQEDAQDNEDDCKSIDEPCFEDQNVPDANE